MRRGEWAEDPEALLKIADRGIVADAALRRIGVSGSAIHLRCKPGGPWQRVLPGILYLRNGSLSPRQRATAALEYGGRDAMLTGRAALREYGFDHATQETHLLLPAERRKQSKGFVVVERTHRLPEPVVRQRLRCAPLVRAALDAARRCTTLDSSRALIAEVVQSGKVTVPALLEELEDGSDRGSALPRKVLREVAANVHSVPEVKARELWLRSGLPEMHFNSDLVDAAGNFIGRPDGWIDDVALAWEIDSLAWHLSPVDYKRTVERRARMQSAGIIVLSTVPSALRDAPSRVLEELRRHYELAASRPRPDVRLLPPAN
ncbi:hypothetical protein [Rhodococcus sp. SMB37]|uniref:hypothetical protein n=1 Tax=Rhodococcus sp. SMB37 TaxID=2512213 RepID=UPI00104F8784|nr:hypothetical protein [Rhodococcus sp. SMB37]